MTTSARSQASYETEIRSWKVKFIEMQEIAKKWKDNHDALDREVIALTKRISELDMIIHALENSPDVSSQPVATAQLPPSYSSQPVATTQLPPSYSSSFTPASTYYQALPTTTQSPPTNSIQPFATAQLPPSYSSSVTPASASFLSSAPNISRQTVSPSQFQTTTQPTNQAQVEEFMQDLRKLNM